MCAIEVSGQLLQRIRPDHYGDHHDFVNEVRRRFAGNGNVINYVATFLDAMLLYGDQVPHDVVLEIMDNVRTAITEHPISETVGVYQYNLIWARGSLISRFGSMDEILRASIDNTSGQIPDFEIRRNEANLKFYEKLKAVRDRSDGKNPQQVFVEFSPSPELTEEARARGYKGNDTVLIYTSNGNHESVSQYWFPRSSESEYRELLIRLNDINPIHDISLLLKKERITDVDVMLCSGGFNGDQITEVMRFINDHQEGVTSRYRKEIESYIPYIEREIKLQILPLLRTTAESLVDGVDDELITRNLLQIRELVDSLQLQLRLFILEGVGINTFSDEEYMFIRFYQNTIGLNPTEFVRRGGYRASGCGFGSNGNIGNMYDIWGQANTLLNPSGGEIMQAVYCPFCGRFIGYVNILDSNTFFTECPLCQKKIPRCG